MARLKSSNIIDAKAGIKAALEGAVQTGETGTPANRIKRPVSVINVPLDQIKHDSEFQTRLKKFDPVNDQEDARFTKDIEERGVIQPVKLQIQSRNPLEYRIVFGHRRVEACRHLGYKTVPALMATEAEVKKADELLVQTVTENAHRKQLTDTERAESAKYLIGLGFNQKEAAAALNISPGMVSLCLSILDIEDQAVKTLVDEGKIGAYTARQIIDIPAPNREKIIKAIEAGYSATEALQLAELNVGNASSATTDQITNPKGNKPTKENSGAKTKSNASTPEVDKVLSWISAADPMTLEKILKTNKQTGASDLHILALFTMTNGEIEAAKRMTNDLPRIVAKPLKRTLKALSQMYDALGIVASKELTGEVTSALIAAMRSERK